MKCVSHIALIAIYRSHDLADVGHVDWFMACVFMALGRGFYWYNVFVNLFRQDQNGSHFADDIFKCILLMKTCYILIRILLKFVPDVPVENTSALVQVKA